MNFYLRGKSYRLLRLLFSAYVLKIVNATRIIYLLIMLIASQPVWSMLDEHSFNADDGAPHEELVHLTDSQPDDDPQASGSQESAENCLHCCHCHFHQIMVVPPAAAVFDSLAARTSPSFRPSPLADAHANDVFRPPII